MSFLDGSLWGVRVFIWLFFAVAVFLFCFVVLYFFREKLNEKYLKMRWPERVVKVVIHYPGSQYYMEFWRLIPDREDFKLDGKLYLYSDDVVLKQNQSYAYTKEDRLVINIEGKEYNLEGNYKIKRRWDRWAEIHYINNVPNPINFMDIDSSSIKFTSKDLETFKENDLFQKLLSLTGEKNMLIFCILLGGANLIASLFIISKLMGWLK